MLSKVNISADLFLRRFCFILIISLIFIIIFFLFILSICMYVIAYLTGRHDLR
jgi:hypothetical protein